MKEGNHNLAKSANRVWEFSTYVRQGECDVA
jgi:hypothetical protein